MPSSRYQLLKDILKQRILVLDGAMGSMIQSFNLTEADFKGERFKDHPCALKGDNDVLVITRPDVIENIHRQYLEAGADIIETDSFNATDISQADYQMESYVYELNKAAAELARRVADEYSTTDKPRFVAGSIGPTNKTASMSADVNDPGARAVTFDDLVASYGEQVRGLLDGGADMFLVETIFDALNCKAALYAINQEVEKRGIDKFPIMVSATIADKSGRILSGQTIDSLLYSVSHIELLTIGLNCSFGARDLKPYLTKLGHLARFYISAHPNAGMPNQFGQYDQTPEMMTEQIKEYLNEGLVNIIGGCCGTTPAHIKAMSDAIESLRTTSPELFHIHQPAENAHEMRLAGLDPLVVDKKNKKFYNVGERTNVAGSRKFVRLISEKNYEEALDIARAEVEAGADIIDVNMDDAMLDAEKEMVTFLNLLAAEPDVARLPIMIDSSKWNVIEAGLKCQQGKAIVNSISLKEGEEKFLDHARTIQKYGAATVVMAFDEKGQADTFERRIEICSRAYKLLTEKINFNPEDIIFDPNVLAIATGIEQHNNYAVDFIRTVKWIKANLPHAKISGGISNLSFSFRGNNPVREAMHCVFLHHAIAEGMDMGIVNPATMMNYDDIDPELRNKLEDVVLNRRPDATEIMVEYAEIAKAKAQGSKPASNTTEWRNGTVEERLQYALQKGITEYLETDLKEAMDKYPMAIDIIKKPLMDGMNMVGELFGQGKMFLPQVVKTARVMKHAVEILRPVIEEEKRKSGKEGSSAGKIIMATVKGDVHDIGKNIVCVVMACNNFDVVDLGVMVPTETIVEKAIELKADAIGLSGLITPSLDEMIKVVQALEAQGLTIPVMIGGATTSDIHTSVKIAPQYSGPVAYVKDASQNAYVATALINGDQKFLEQLKQHQEDVRKANTAKQSLSELLPIEKARSLAHKTDWSKADIRKPNNSQRIVMNDIDLNTLVPFINWKMLLISWKISGDFSGLYSITNEDEGMRWLKEYDGQLPDKAEEAVKILLDSKRILRKMIDNRLTKANAVVQIMPASSQEETVSVYTDEKHKEEKAQFHFLRQQKADSDGHCTSLADYIAPTEYNDHLGMFAATAGIGLKEHTDKLLAEGNDYEAIMMKLLADRLVEALSEYLHYKVRTEIWGYAADEPFQPSEMIRGNYVGIRPAIGYPADPDHRHKQTVFDLLGAEKATGIQLTETMGMNPAASVCGFYIANAKAKYIIVGDTDNQN
ncbi:MAG: methionine synthase [Bacteroidales bacterium]|nr:methionine synthase [Bacteroidales bacterium]